MYRGAVQHDQNLLCLIPCIDTKSYSIIIMGLVRVVVGQNLTLSFG
jgi:hypothetical protein